MIRSIRAAPLQRQLDLDRDLAARRSPRARPDGDAGAAGSGGALAVQLALAHPRRARVPPRHLQAHVGDRRDVREHARRSARHG